MTSARPKICIVSATPLTVQFFFKKHLLELVRNYDVTLIYNPKSDSYVHPLNIPLREIGVGIERKIAPLSDGVALYQLWRFFRREQFQGVITLVPKAGLLGILAAFLAGVPNRVHIFQGEVWASKTGFLRALLKIMDGFIVRFATDVLAVSFGERQFLENEGVAPMGRIKVLGSGSICGVDTERFKPDQKIRLRMRESLNIPFGALVCVFLGRLNADKGIVELIQAFSDLASTQKDLWLLIVGPTEADCVSECLKKIPTDILKRIIKKPFTREPENILKAADFLCLPSYREGFGMVILEAAASGIPAIGTQIYGVSDAIEDGKTGILVPAGDVGSLASAIKRLCENKEERICFSKAAMERVKLKFEQKKVVSAYVDYFNQVFKEQLAPKGN